MKRLEDFSEWKEARKRLIDLQLELAALDKEKDGILERLQLATNQRIRR